MSHDVRYYIGPKRSPIDAFRSAGGTWHYHGGTWHRAEDGLWIVKLWENDEDTWTAYRDRVVVARAGHHDELAFKLRTLKERYDPLKEARKVIALSADALDELMGDTDIEGDDSRAFHAHISAVQFLKKAEES